MKPWILFLLAGLILSTQLTLARTPQQHYPLQVTQSSNVIVIQLSDVGSSAKPGECPKVKIPPDYPCQQKCVWDSSCPGTEKCCPVGCARECFPPDTQMTMQCPFSFCQPFKVVRTRKSKS